MDQLIEEVAVYSYPQLTGTTRNNWTHIYLVHCKISKTHLIDQYNNWS